MALAGININSLQKNIKEVTTRQVETAKTLTKEKSRLAQMQKELEDMEKLCKTNQYEADHATRELSDICELIPRKEESIEDLFKEISDLHVSIDNMSDEKFKANMIFTSESSQRQTFMKLMQEHTDREQTLKEKKEALAAIKLLKLAQDAKIRKKSELYKSKEELLIKIEAAKNVRDEKEQKCSELAEGILPLRNRNRALMLRLRNHLKKSQEHKSEVSKRLDLLEQKLAETQSCLAAMNDSTLESSM